MKTTINFSEFTCLHGFALAFLTMIILALINGDFSEQEEAVRVAMIGNSIMYYNDLPRLLEAMSGGQLTQDSCLHGDASLESHLVYGNGMLEKWNTGQARMWDVDEKEASHEYYYDIYYNSYGSSYGGDDASSSNYDDQTFDEAYIYDFGACTVEQLLLGYDDRLKEVYEGDEQTDDDDSNNRWRKKRQRWRMRNLQMMTNSSSLHERWRYRQQDELLQQLSGSIRQDHNHDRIRKRRRRRVEDAGDDVAANDDDDNAGDDQAVDYNDDGNGGNAAAADDDASASAAAADDDYASANQNDDGDDAYYTSTDDGGDGAGVSYDDDYYQDTYNDKYPLQDDGTNPCLLSANYYFFKQRQYDDFGPPQWDYVLINDNSRAPCCTEQRATGLELLEDVYVPWLRQTKAVPIFMVTHSYWASKRDMSGLTDIPTFLSLTYEGYKEYAETVGKALPERQKPRIAPVGLAFLLIWEENPSMWYDLIHQDEIHLTPSGTYLEGLIVYATIYGRLPNTKIVLNGDIANLFSGARRMTPSEHIQEAYPTMDQARYLYHIARRIMDGELPRSFIQYDDGDSADFVPNDEQYQNQNRL